MTRNESGSGRGMRHIAVVLVLIGLIGCGLTAFDTTEESDGALLPYITYDGISYRITNDLFDGTAVVGAVALDGTPLPAVDSDVTRVTIPDSFNYLGRTYQVVAIGESAFEGLTSLKSVTISRGITSIDDRAFYGCTELTSVSIPNTVTSVGEQAFYGCESLQSISSGATKMTLGDQAFFGCTSLESVNLSFTSGTLGSSVFEGCTSLREIDLSGARVLTSRLFANCTSLETVTVSSTYLYSIETGSFTGCGTVILSVVGGEDDTVTLPGTEDIEFVSGIADLPLTMCDMDGRPIQDISAYSGTAMYIWGTVEPVLESISIETLPDKTVYEHGQILDTTGMTVRAHYSDGSSELVTGWSIVGSQTLNYGTDHVTVSYSESDVTVTAEFPVTVNETVTATHITVDTMPTKSVYTEGEDFDSTGMTVQIHYSDGSYDEITGWYITSGEDLSTDDDHVTVAFDISGESFYVDVPITVLPAETAVLETIVVRDLPDKTTYNEGEDFDPTGMVIRARYSDGSTKIVTGWTVIDGEDLSYGTTYVTVSYTEGEHTATARAHIKVEKVPVVTVVSIEIVTPPDKTVYVLGEYFDPTGMTVRAHYSDGSEKMVDGWVVDTNKITSELSSVKVVYEENTYFASAEVPITTLMPETVLESISIASEPDKIEYTEGEDFDPTGMSVRAYYSDFSQKIVDDWTVIDGGNLSADTDGVTITYTEGDVTLSIEIYIIVHEKVVPKDLYLDMAEVRHDYVEGEDFDPTGLTAYLVYTDWSEKMVTGWTVLNGDDLSLDQDSVTISYTEDGTTYEAEVWISVIPYDDETDVSIFEDGNTTTVLETRTDDEGTVYYSCETDTVRNESGDVQSILISISSGDVRAEVSLTAETTDAAATVEISLESGDPSDADLATAIELADDICERAYAHGFDTMAFVEFDRSNHGLDFTIPAEVFSTLYGTDTGIIADFDNYHVYIDGDSVDGLSSIGDVTFSSETVLLDPEVDDLPLGIKSFRLNASGDQGAVTSLEGNAIVEIAYYADIEGGHDSYAVYAVNEDGTRQLLNTYYDHERHRFVFETTALTLFTLDLRDSQENGSDTDSPQDASDSGSSMIDDDSALYIAIIAAIAICAAALILWHRKT